MQIRRMNAVFGVLQGQTLELKPGLNILQAPNESGKSTWCAFLLSMFYGVNSRERDRAGSLADKTHYAPWNGAAMSGRLECRFQEDELTLIRTTRRAAAPMAEFQALYRDTNTSVPGLTAAACGETLLGAGREVYARSAFIRQSGLAISQDAGLERRLAALITSGEEDTSYSEAAEALRRQQRRRRHNKSGQLPALEAALEEAGRQLSERQAVSGRLEALQDQAAALQSRRSALEEELSALDRWEASRQRQAVTDAENAAALAEARVQAAAQSIRETQTPEAESISRLRGAIINMDTTRRSAERAKTQRDQAQEALAAAEAAVADSPFAGQTPAAARREAAQTPPKPRLPLPLGILSLLWLILGMGGLLFPAALPLSLPLLGALWLCGALGLAVGFLYSVQRSRNTWRAGLIRRFGTDDPAALSALADAYIQLLEDLDAAREDAAAKDAAAEGLLSVLSSSQQSLLLTVRRFAPEVQDLRSADRALQVCALRWRELSQAEAALKEARLRRDLLVRQHPDLPESAGDVPPPARKREAILEDLEILRGDAAALRAEASQLSGRLQAQEDPAEQCRQLQAEIALREREYSALQLALDALDQANTTLQSHFAPALGRRAAEIFSAMTGGAYSAVALDRQLHLTAEPAGSGLPRDAAFLSAGAADQLYLAVRLAICQLALPPETPIVLDDALANFDGDRCAAALRWLRKEAQTRQILLFTCHSREAEFFAGDREVSIQRLTGPAEKV